jgi:hypothetical protein
MLYFQDPFRSSTTAIREALRLQGIVQRGDWLVPLKRGTAPRLAETKSRSDLGR